MLCFREGCPHGIDQPSGVELIVGIGTRGSIGTSRAKISAKFCSIICVKKFLDENENQTKVLKKIAELCETEHHT